MNLPKVACKPDGRIETISELANNSVLVVIENISNLDRMILSWAVACETFFGNGAGWA